MFEPKLFLNLAEELKDSRKDDLFESRVRASVGRSYYSIFLATRYKIERLVNKELENRKDIHRILIEELKKSKNNTLAEFGSHLESLRNYRHQADYRIRVNMNHNIAVFSHKLSDNLFDDLKKLPDEDLKSLFQPIF